MKWNRNDDTFTLSRKELADLVEIGEIALKYGDDCIVSEWSDVIIAADELLLKKFEEECCSEVSPLKAFAALFFIFFFWYVWFPFWLRDFVDAYRHVRVSWFR